MTIMNRFRLPTILFDSGWMRLASTYPGSTMNVSFPPSVPGCRCSCKLVEHRLPALHSFTPCMFVTSAALGPCLTHILTDADLTTTVAAGAADSILHHAAGRGSQRPRAVEE